ncbi:hypothetical protein ACOJIV_28295, partial [Haloarcula sp. AONF1]
LPDDVSLESKFSLNSVEVEEMRFYHDEEGLDRKEETYEDVTASARVSSSMIGFAVIPEPEVVVFPFVPVGDAFSPEGGAANEMHLQRLINLIENTDQDIEQNSIEPTLDEDYISELSELQYGHEIIEHAQDADICREQELLHLAISSYIHAIEWTAITYLNQNGLDIVENEKNGNYYNFAGGNNSMLDELKETADIDQKMITQLESMNRAERRWMAHHKSGKILPEEVEAIRARFNSLVELLF